YDYARALERTERFFWSFCDDYVELVKQRAYTDAGAPAGSARTALRLALDALLRLFAPHLPFVTEEVWSWSHEGSIHLAAGPDGAELQPGAARGDPLVFDAAAAVLGEVRKAKTGAQRSLRTEVERVVVRDAGARLEALRASLDDVKDAARAKAIELVNADALTVEVELSASDAA